MDRPEPLPDPDRLPGVRADDPAAIGALVEFEAAVAQPSLSRWLDGTIIRRNVLEGLAPLLDRVSAATSPASSTREGGWPAPSLIAWRRDAVMLVEPMAHADSRPLPHAIVRARSTDPESASDLARMLACIRERFAPHALDRFCLFVHGPQRSVGPLAPAPARSTSPSVRPYKRFLAASIVEILREAPPQVDRVSVSTPTSLSFYPEYEAMYEAFWASSPELRDAIGIESHEDLESYLTCDGLRLVHVDGELAGLIAGIRHAEFGLRGWRLRERVMGERFRGGGFATAALWQHIRSLRHEPDDLVWGTILGQNHASMRSALRLGRVDIGGLIWVGG